MLRRPVGPGGRRNRAAFPFCTRDTVGKAIDPTRSKRGRIDRHSRDTFGFGGREIQSRCRSSVFAFKPGHRLDLPVSAFVLGSLAHKRLDYSGGRHRTRCSGQGRQRRTMRYILASPSSASLDIVNQAANVVMESVGASSDWVAFMRGILVCNLVKPLGPCR
jgi:hypothetical protein